MPRAHPEPTCFEARFAAGYSLEEAAEVALEDYARELARAQAAETFRGERGVGGVHLCGLATPPSSAVLADIEDFARLLVGGEGSSGLGWS